MPIYDRQEKTIEIDNAQITILVDNSKSTSNSYRDIYHTHIYAEIFACKTGEISIMHPDGSQAVSEGGIGIVPPGFAHYRYINSTENCEWLCIHVLLSKTKADTTYDLYSKLYNLLYSGGIKIFKNKSSFYSEAEEYFKSITDKDDVFDIVSLSAQICSLAKDYGLSENKNNAETGAKRHRDVLLNFEYLLHKHLNDNVSVKDLAEELFIGERQLYRIVKQYYGEPIHSLVIKKRLLMAARLLLSTTLSVEEIALEVGFQNKVSFHREFKKHYGSTPLQYRKAKAKK